MKLFRSNIHSSLVVLIVFLSSCGGGSQETESTESASGDEFDAAKSQILSDINQVIKDLPPPSEVPYLLMATGSDYDPDLINPLDNLDGYTSTTSSAALNLGIYMNY